jgi:hypothetical protein
MLPMRFEPTISVGERPKTYALDRTATGTGLKQVVPYQFQIARMGLTSNVAVILLDGSCNVVSYYFERLAITRR